jgi:DNA-binding transcriptional regulator LsrR (DeoR family)
MSRERTDMRKIRDIIRLHFDCKMSTNQVAGNIGVARSVVQECLRRVKAKGLIWPLPEELDDFQLERLLYSAPQPLIAPHIQTGVTFIKNCARRA